MQVALALQQLKLVPGVRFVHALDVTPAACWGLHRILDGT
jgi:hypothetical protein